jgi:sulfate permease, SulP family
MSNLPQYGRQLAQELLAPPLAPNLLFAFMFGLLEIMLAASFAALIFSGELSGAIGTGLGLMIFSAAIASFMLGMFSSLPGTLGGIQSLPVTIMAGLVLTLGESLSGETLLVTAVVMMSLTTLLTGILFWLMARFQIGNLVRFLPYPVVGGFLAGTGWLLITGSLRLMTDIAFSWQTLPAYLQPELLGRWLPGAILGAVLLWAVLRFQHFLVLPGVLLTAVALFYLPALLLGIPLSQIQAQGWVLGPFIATDLIPPFIWPYLPGVSWPAIAAQLPNLASIIFLSAIALLLNISGLETLNNQDVNVNRDVQVAGYSNLISGFFGGMIVYHQIGLSILTIKTGSSRIVGTLAALICILGIIAGGQALSFFPKIIAGGILFFLGLNFLKDWVYQAWFRLPHVEYAIVLGIWWMIATAGFLPGVALGLVAAISLFVITYSRTEVVRHELTGRQITSRLTRSPQEQQRLEELGEQIYILRLQGYLFFGTADRLLKQVQQRTTQTPPVRYVLLDMARVTGVDSTALRSFQQMVRMLLGRQAVLLITNAPTAVQSQMQSENLGALYYPDLDAGLEWCENQLLGHQNQPQPPRDLLTLLQALLPNEPQLAEILPYLTPRTLAEGEYLIVQGELANDIYFVESGRITIQLEEPGQPPLRLQTYEAGTVLGEIGYYLGQTRTASVVADTTAVVHRLTQTEFNRMNHENPTAAALFHRLIIQILAMRTTYLIGTVRALEQ